MQRRLLGYGVLLLLVSGCAGLATQPAPEPLCIPPAVGTAFLAWQVRWASPARFQDMVGLAVRYEQGSQAVLVLWHADRLVYVDPDPDGNAPPWRRLSEACHWSQDPQEST